MTRARMALPMISRLIACVFIALSVGATRAAMDGSEIPSRVERPYGQLRVSADTEIKLSVVSAGEWARERLILVNKGQELWRSPLLDFLVNPKLVFRNEEKLVRFDIDGNGKADWLYLAMTRPLGSYGVSHSETRLWTEEETKRNLSSEWDPVLCDGLAGVIVLDDEKTVYAFNYTSEPDPFMHSNPYIQGKEHFKGVVQGTTAPRMLEVSTSVPSAIWNSLRKLIESRSCNTPDPISKLPLKAEWRIKWDLKPVPFGTDWHPYFEEGLGMYRRAKEVYEERKKTINKEDLLTQQGLSVFRFDAFFNAFPYDEMDPDNKSAEYTSMLNDYAFYLMAPADADKAVGADSRRDPVDESVIAMLAQVIRRAPKRTVAYLNLGDALWRNKQDNAAAGYYQRYAELLQTTNPKAKPPKRVIERIKH
jgi:hypothetical protein